MPGLIALASFIVLLILLFIGAAKLADLLPIPVGARIALMFLMVIGFFPLMMIDEIIGKYQFEALCKANGIEGADISRAKGKKVRLEISENVPLQGLMVPVVMNNRFYRDVNTGEVLIRHKSYFSYGGWIMRMTPLNMGSKHPMLFFGGCGAESMVVHDIFRKNNISIVN